MNRFVINGRYGDIPALYGINIEEVLRKAQLPGDTFRHKTVTMSEENYFLFLKTLGSFIKDETLPIKLATTENIESFSPPIFASYCSANGEICIERLARYKRLIGPMGMLVTKTEKETKVAFTASDKAGNIPQFLAETEFAFLVGMLRRTTKEEITPTKILMIEPVKTDAFKAFFKVPAESGTENSITFRNEDLQIPFVSRNEAMWDYFEPELKRRLSELEADEPAVNRVRSALKELLPGGACGISDAAKKLGMSTRTFQRKLSDEGTTFRNELNTVRELLAKHYLKNSGMPTADIAFLLGYSEINSFLRAFSEWTGMTVSDYRKKNSNR